MDLSYRWVIVSAGALMTCVAAGAMFSLAVFALEIARIDLRAALDSAKPRGESQTHKPIRLRA